MLAVSNTSPLSNLAFIHRLDLMKSQISELWITTAVAEELQAHPDSLARAAIETAIRDQWIRVSAPQNTRLKTMLLRQVHRGEAEAIALAAGLKADLLFIDELERRGLAEQAGIAITGTLGVLLLAKRTGHIRR
jgi:predicted nucleic acid-binding protein